MKGYSYETDIPHSVKNTSALPIYSIAYMLDDSTIFNDRAVPITEFMLSRTNFAYADDGSSGAGQSAYNTLGDPCMKTTELMAYYALGDKHSSTFLDLALANPKTSSNLALESKWRESIALYNGTGEEEYFSKVQSGADKYLNERISTKQTGFNYINNSTSSFWSSLAPKFWEFYETYQITGLERHLYAAQQAARIYAYHLWMAPAVPDEMVTCNIGGKAPSYRSGTPISIPEEEAPAWRLSSVGLSCEAGGTATSGHRAVFMANHAPYFMRIGALTNDQFLMDIAKAAIIGRWRSFPGYHINTDRTTVYEKDDFAHRSMSSLLTTTSMHYSHLWPMIAMTFDYLVSDAFARSNSAIDFPDQFIENTANIYNNLYFEAGEFYGEEDVTLWMPVGLVSSDNQELNFIVARGNGKLYLAFTNQSNSEVTAQISIDIDKLSIDGKTAKVWTDNVENGSLAVNDNAFEVTVSPNGITAIAIDDVMVETKFQEKMGHQSYKNEWVDAYEELPTADARTMILGFSNEYTRIYAFSDAIKGTYSSVQFTSYFDGVKKYSISDTSYPYEYGQAIPRSVTNVRLVITTNTGATEEVTFVRSPYTVTASVSGWTSVKSGKKAPVSYAMDGELPWFLRYTDGETIYEKTLTDNVFIDSVMVDGTTSFTMLSAVDGDDEAADITSSKVKVSIIDEHSLSHKLLVSEDAYVNSLGGDNKYGTETILKLRGKESGKREFFLKYDLSQADRDGDIYLVGVWLSANISSTVVMTIQGSDESWDETSITYNNKPSFDGVVAIDTIGISELSPGGNYFYFDVTDFIKAYAENTVTFRVAYSSGDEATEIRFLSKEEGDVQHSPYLIADVYLTDGVSTIEDNQIDQNLRIYVNEQRDLGVITEHNVQSIQIINMMGYSVAKVNYQQTISLSSLNSGVYIAIIKMDKGELSERFIVQ